MQPMIFSLGELVAMVPSHEASLLAGFSALEALAAAAYEKDVLSFEQVRRLLGLESRWEAQDVLSSHGVWPGTTLEEVLQDAEVATASRVLPG